MAKGMISFHFVASRNVSIAGLQSSVEPQRGLFANFPQYMKCGMGQDGRTLC